MADSALRPYVEYGGKTTSPAPFLTTGGRLTACVVRGEQAKIDALVARVLDEPADGAVRYRAFGEHLLLMVGAFEHVSSTRAPFDTWGSLEEVQAAFFIPVLSGKVHGEVFLAERLSVFIPFIFVDNPMSYAGGREDYGFAKSMGIFTPADAQGPAIGVQTYGGDFGPGARAGWRPILDLAPADATCAMTEAIDGAGDVARLLRHHWLKGEKGADGKIVLPGLHLLGEIEQAITKGLSELSFLKQFRASGDGTRACYQATVEATMRVTRVRATPLSNAVDLTVHPLDSHPLGPELGVSSQRAHWAMAMELDFVLDGGRVTGPSGVG